MTTQHINIIDHSIQKALRLYQENGERLMATADIRRLLDQYADAIDHTQATMLQNGVSDMCSRCAAETGSCCFQEVETWYDPILLLINRLLDADLPLSRQIPDQCIFLGPQGCRLRARYSFCLNYFCPTLKERLGSTGMKIALSAVGTELAAGWELEQAIYRWHKDKA